MSALVWCPFPDEDSAAAVATQLLDEKLIACANIMGPVRALYDWNGERGDAREVGVLFKTDGALLAPAMARLEALHPYETPAVMGWPCAAAPGTAEWLSRLAK